MKKNRGNWDIEKSKIDQVIMGYFGVDFLNRKRNPDICFPRQVRAYCLYVFTDLTLKDIAKNVGLVDHGTILYTVKIVRGLCKVDAEVRQKVIEIESMIE